MAKDIEVPIVRADFEVDVLGPIPLIQNFLHVIRVIIELEADRTLVSLRPGVTLHVHIPFSFAAISAPLR